MLTRLLKSIYKDAVLFKSKLQYGLRHQIKTYTLKGVRLSVDDDTVLSKDVLLSVLQRGYEDIEHRIMLQNLKPDDRVLELGAGLGFNSIAAAKINGSKILAYESNPYLVPLIRRNQLLNHVSFEVRNKILVCQKDHAPTISFNISENENMSSIKDYQREGHKIKKVIETETEYIGDVLASFSPTFLIVDIEGGEEDLFSDTDFLVQSTVQKILVEVDPEIIGEEACSIVVKNILNAGFILVTRYCEDSRLFFERKLI
jgi:FkbM family methyltransferase